MKIEIADSFFKSIYYMNSWQYKIRKLPRTIRLWLFPRAKIQSRYLKTGWIDYCDILPFSMFEILQRFVDQECSPGCVEWYGLGGHKVLVNGEEKYARDEMDDLLNWWNNEYVPWYFGKDKHTTEINKELEKYNIGIIRFTKILNKNKESRNEDENEYIELINSLNKKESEMHLELQEKMQRLIKLQPSMWT